VKRGVRSPLSVRNYRRAYRLAAVAAAALPHLDLRGPHDLRHTFATWLVSERVPVNVVQAVMGHEQASTTLNRYTHVPADSHARVRAALNAPAACSPPAGVRSAGDDR
jgi:integrase